MNKFFYLLSILILNCFIVDFSWANNINISAFLTQKKAFTLPFPSTQSIILDEFIMENGVLKRGEKTLLISINKANGELTFSSNNANEEIIIVVNANFKLVSKDVLIKNSTYADMLDYNHRKISFVGDTKKVKIMEFKAGKEVHSDSVNYNNNMIWQGISAALLQGVLLAKRGSFSAQLLADSNGKVASLQYSLKEVINLQALSPEYIFPKKYQQCLKLKEPHKAFQVKMIGILGLFFSDKFYYLYANKPPYALIAVWGGKPEDVSFAFNQAYFANSCMPTIS